MIPISNNSIVDNRVVFSVHLSNESAGATLGLAEMTITIDDNDAAASGNPSTTPGSGSGAFGWFELACLSVAGLLGSRRRSRSSRRR